MNAAFQQNTCTATHINTLKKKQNTSTKTISDHMLQVDNGDRFLFTIDSVGSVGKL